MIRRAAVVADGALFLIIERSSGSRASYAQRYALKRSSKTTVG
jgi:hypothetical protein